MRHNHSVKSLKPEDPARCIDETRYSRSQRQPPNHLLPLHLQMVIRCDLDDPSGADLFFKHRRMAVKLQTNDDEYKHSSVAYN